jgi:aldehyde:ferredoxin oxidoreductase
MSAMTRHKTSNQRVADVMKKFTDKVLLPNIFKILITTGKLMPWLGSGDRRMRGAEIEEFRRRIVDFDYMINEFYRLRDLDDRGFPMRARLEKLGLSDVADALEKV